MNKQINNEYNIYKLIIHCKIIVQHKNNVDFLTVLTQNYICSVTKVLTVPYINEFRD